MEIQSHVYSVDNFIIFNNLTPAPGYADGPVIRVKTRVRQSILSNVPVRNNALMSSLIAITYFKLVAKCNCGPFLHCRLLHQ